MKPEGPDPTIVKTSGPDPDGKFRGHCYDGTGWVECSFWEYDKETGKSRCMLFGGPDGVSKWKSKALRICDEVYGTDYTGDV